MTVHQSDRWVLMEQGRSRPIFHDSSASLSTPSLGLSVEWNYRYQPDTHRRFTDDPNPTEEKNMICTVERFYSMSDFFWTSKSVNDFPHWFIVVSFTSLPDTRSFTDESLIKRGKTVSRNPPDDISSWETFTSQQQTALWKTSDEETEDNKYRTLSCPQRRVKHVLIDKKKEWENILMRNSWEWIFHDKLMTTETEDFVDRQDDVSNSVWRRKRIETSRR